MGSACAYGLHSTSQHYLMVRAVRTWITDMVRLWYCSQQFCQTVPNHRARGMQDDTDTEFYCYGHTTLFYARAPSR